MSSPKDIWDLQTPGQMAKDPELKSAMATVSGELQVGFREDDISINFQYGPSAYDTVTSVTGSATVTSYKAMAKIAVDTGVEVATLTSRSAVRYRAGHETLGAFSHVFAPPQENLNQYAGFLNGDDGFSLGYQGLVFGIWYIEGGNVSFIPQSSFIVNSADGSGRPGFDLDPTKLNIYKVTYGWHGGLPAFFSVYGGWLNGWILLHVIDEVNTSTETHLENPYLPLAAKIERTAGSGVASAMYAGSWRGGVIAGGPDSNLSNRMFHYTVLEGTIAANTLTALLMLRSKTTFQGKQNHITCKPITISFSSSGNKDVIIYGIPFPTVTGAPVWVDTDSDNSVMEFSKAILPVTSPAPSSAPSTVLGKLSLVELDASARELFILPGDILAVCALSSQTSDISISMSVSELF